MLFLMSCMVGLLMVSIGGQISLAACARASPGAQAGGEQPAGVSWCVAMGVAAFGTAPGSPPHQPDTHQARASRSPSSAAPRAARM
jgi:hypothetical protein